MELSTARSIRQPNAEPIPGYRLIEPLGAGGFGEVWKCEAPGGLFKAIKFVFGGDERLLGNNLSGAEQELQALQLVKSIRHPFLLSMDRVEQVASELVIVMELADKSLHDLLEERQAAGKCGLPRPELLLYLREAAEVLDLMNHEYGLQHLDIKPRNLFMVGGHVKVADFGLVNQLPDAGSQPTTKTLGAITPVYASPECFLGKISPFSDQYSLAIVFCELLTGQLPYNGKNFRQLMLQHSTGMPNLEKLPDADRPIVLRALDKDPSKRYPRSMDFVRALIAVESLPSTQLDTASSELTKAATIQDLCLVEKGRTDSLARPTRAIPTAEQVQRPATDPILALHDYHFIDCLGRNPLGELWKIEGADGVPRLLKLVNTFSMGAQASEESPIERLQKITHRGLVPTLLMAYPPNRIAIISELLTESLATRLQACKAQSLPGIPRDELLGYLKTVAETLDQLHAQHGLQHLGLNPRNVILLNNRASMTDFGLMALLWLPAGQDVGSINPRYTPPELLGRQIDASGLKACDQYSLAQIYHEMLTGTHLFGNLTQRQLAVARASGRIDLEMLPSPDRPMVARALEADPDRRFRSCMEFIRSLQAATVGSKGNVEESGWVPLGEVDGNPEDSGFVGIGARVSKVLTPNPEKCIAGLLQATASEVQGRGARQIREFRGAWYALEPGHCLEHSCYVRLVPGTIKLRLGGFREQWPIESLEEINPECYLMQIRLQASLWQRCTGRMPGLELQVQVIPPEQPFAIFTTLHFRLQTVACKLEEGIHALERTGLMLMDSLRTHLQVGPERRSQLRVRLPGEVHIYPIVSGERLGDPVGCVARDLSSGGIGVVLPCKPTSRVVLFFEPPTGQSFYVLAEVARLDPLGNGEYEVGFRFGHVNRTASRG